MRFVNAPVEREGERQATTDSGRLRLLLVAVASASLTLASIFGRHGVLDVQRYRAERDRLKAEITQMEQDRHRLETELAAIRQDPSALEKSAREDLTLGRPGEAVILLVPPPSTAQPPHER